MTRDPWKLVTSAGELRAGMCVELRPCATCGKCERFMLLGKERGTTFCPSHGRCKGWTTSSWHRESLCKNPSAIAERRLYALIDDDTADGETEFERGLERAMP